MVCTNCGTENRPGRKFCSQCGQPLGIIGSARTRDQTPFLRGTAYRFRRLAAHADDLAEAERSMHEAISVFREIDSLFYVGVCSLELGEMLTNAGRVDDARQPLREAEERFEELRAAPWLERTSRVAAPKRATVPT
jgi:zinc-ribbon domain